MCLPDVLGAACPLRRGEGAVRVSLFLELVEEGRTCGESTCAGVVAIGPHLVGGELSTQTALLGCETSLLRQWSGIARTPVVSSLRNWLPALRGGAPRGRTFVAGLRASVSSRYYSPFGGARARHGSPRTRRLTRHNVTRHRRG